MTMQYKREDVIRALKEAVVEIVFTKLDGTMRTMQATLDPSHMPPGSDTSYLDEMHQRPEYQDRIVAWDMQAKGWRTIVVHKDNIKLVQEVPGYSN